MTPDEIAAERERFWEWRQQQPRGQGDSEIWLARAEIARDEQAELRAELESVCGAMDAQDERERVAGERCGVSREQHGCDWPEWVADEVLRLRAELAEWQKWFGDLPSVRNTCGMAAKDL